MKLTLIVRVFLVSAALGDLRHLVKTWWARILQKQPLIGASLPPRSLKINMVTRLQHVASRRPREQIYLCNWFVKLVRPGRELPNNEVQCRVPMK